MKYESIQEISLKWNISPRRIRVLCDEGRVEGAMKVGSQWVIPALAQKPKDLRIKNGLYRKESNSMGRINVETLKDLSIRLKFRMSEEEYETLQDEFDVILKQMELLGEIVGLDSIEPMVFPFNTTTLGMREDEVDGHLTKEEVLKNAKDVQNDMIKVKKVVG